MTMTNATRLFAGDMADARGRSSDQGCQPATNWRSSSTCRAFGGRVDDHEKTRLTDTERIDWLQLIRADNVGPRTFQSLLRHCGSARAALDALPELARRGGGRTKIHPRQDAEAELEAVRRLGAVLVASSEPDYPQRLAEIDDAPPLVTLRGKVEALEAPMIAVVGSRNASAAGLKVAERIARELGEAGFTIVSGLARGIDAAAHRASLATGTVAVLAGGHDRIYPRHHAGLLDAILADGAAISEMPLGWEPRAPDFPRRNRIISGLSLGVVVVEAAERSGSLITARFSLEQGREVFAMPGSPLDPRTAGTNSLIKQGATLVTEAADVIEVVRPIMGVERAAPRAALRATPREPPREAPPVRPAAAPLAEPESDARDHVTALLGPTPIGVDDLVRLTGATAAAVRTILFELELAGRIRRHAGGTVTLV
jgi:DNA processing protein